MSLDIHNYSYKQGGDRLPWFLNPYGNECGKNKSNEDFKTTIPSKNYDRPITTRECGIF